MRKVLSVLVLVALSPLLAVIALGCLCSLPFLKAFYKRSPWYRDLGGQYTWGIESTAFYKIYNLAAKVGLPVEHREMKGDHFFFFEDRVLFSLCDYVDELFYSEEDRCFMVLPSGEEEEKRAVSLDEFMETLLAGHGLEETTDLWTVVSEGALGDHVKEGRELFAVYADQSELKLLLTAFCERQENPLAEEQETVKSEE
jgi:hypothetical protein